MLMQLKPGRHGSDSDVHSLMSVEVGVGDREPGTVLPQALAFWSRAILGSSQSWAPSQPWIGLWSQMSPCPSVFHDPKAFTSWNSQLARWEKLEAEGPLEPKAELLDNCSKSNPCSGFSQPAKLSTSFSINPSHTSLSPTGLLLIPWCLGTAHHRAFVHAAPPSLAYSAL